MEEKDLELLNPQARKVKVGKRRLKEVVIYPLALADQFKFTEKIFEIFVFWSQNTDVENSWSFLQDIRGIIQKNLGEVLALVTDEGDKLLEEITNEQALDVADLIYQVNYKSLEKKALNLLQIVPPMFGLSPLSPTSAEPIPNIDLETSTEEAGEKEDSQ